MRNNQNTMRKRWWSLNVYLYHFSQFWFGEKNLQTFYQFRINSMQINTSFLLIIGILSISSDKVMHKMPIRQQSEFRTKVKILNSCIKHILAYLLYIFERFIFQHFLLFFCKNKYDCTMNNNQRGHFDKLSIFHVKIELQFPKQSKKTKINDIEFGIFLYFFLTEDTSNCIKISQHNLLTIDPPTFEHIKFQIVHKLFSFRCRIVD